MFRTVAAERTVSRKGHLMRSRSNKLGSALHFRDFSRFSEERPLPHVVDFGSVTLCVTPLCASGALEKARVTNFRALKIGTDPVHGLIFQIPPSAPAARFGIAMIR